MMKKIRLALASAALLLAAGMAKQAVADPTITISGAVSISSCTISLDPTLLNLGNHARASFPAALTVLPASQRNFAITLKDCTGANDTETELLVAVTGNNMTGNTQIFIPSGSTGNVGIQLSEPGHGKIANGDLLALGTTDSSESPEFAITPITISAGLITTATGDAIDVGNISVPITFNYVAR